MIHECLRRATMQPNVDAMARASLYPRKMQPMSGANARRTRVLLKKRSRTSK
jgi:hypothetical protein